MMFMVSSAEILTAYISLELLSFSLYVLVAFNRFSNRANEASIKYILLGSMLGIWSKIYKYKDIDAIS